MGEYIYYSNGTPMKNAAGEISLPRNEIVRCEDCEWSFASHVFDRINSRYCMWFQHDVYIDEGFCFWGKRRDENNGS